MNRLREGGGVALCEERNVVGGVVMGARARAVLALFRLIIYVDGTADSGDIRLVLHILSNFHPSTFFLFRSLCHTMFRFISL